MKKAIIISLIILLFFTASAQRIELITSGDNLATALGKVNKVIDDNIVKNGSTIYVIDFGVVADGSTDDGPAIQSAFDYAPAGSIIEFPAGKSIKISTSIYTEKQFTILGNYVNIICDSNIPAFYLNVQDECVFRDFTFTGSGRNVSTKKDQVGLMFNGGTRHQIGNLRFNYMSGVGLLGVNNYGESSTLQQQGSNIYNIVLWQNNTGIALMSRSEYNVMTNIVAFENNTGIQDYSGNNVLDGFNMMTNFAYGYRMAAGNNVGHGSIANGSFNHHNVGFGIHTNANGTGVLINNVNFYQTHNKFENGSKAVIFSNCAFDGTASGGAITFDGSTSVHNIVQNCLFTVAATDPKTKIVATSSGKFTVVNMTRIDGTVFNFGSVATTLMAAKTSNYTVTSGDAKWVTKFDCTSGALTATILSAAGMDGQRLVFQKIDASSNAMILDPTGSETINGSSTSLSITNQWQSVTLESNGVGWVRLDNSGFEGNVQIAGSIGSTGNRVTKGWFTDLEVTNPIPGTIGGSVGLTDNAIPRADGTGGSTLQSSGVSISDTDVITATGYKQGSFSSGGTSYQTQAYTLGGYGASSTGFAGLSYMSDYSNNTVLYVEFTVILMKSDGTASVSATVQSRFRKNNSGTWIADSAGTAVTSDATVMTTLVGDINGGVPGITWTSGAFAGTYAGGFSSKITAYTY